jgi:hypothetical protein
MWCPHCGQDVPGVASNKDGVLCCPHCRDITPPTASAEREEIHYRVDPPLGRAAEPARPAPRPNPHYDSWEMDEDLRHVERLLLSSRPAEPVARRTRPARADRYRVDRAHSEPPIRHRPPARKRKKPAKKERHPLLAAVAWIMLSLGTMIFACGGVLLAWSVLDARQELWTIGIPMALAGQIALLAGLVLQLDRIWRDHREAAEKIDTVDQRLDELKTTTKLLGTMHGPSAAFYAHWADGAGPQLLLSDLKSQLDLLAVKLAEE